MFSDRSQCVSYLLYFTSFRFVVLDPRSWREPNRQAVNLIRGLKETTNNERKAREKNTFALVLTQIPRINFSLKGDTKTYFVNRTRMSSEGLIFYNKGAYE